MFPSTYLALASLFVAFVHADPHGNAHHNLHRRGPNCHRRHHNKSGSKTTSSNVSQGTDAALNRQGKSGSWGASSSQESASTAMASATGKASSSSSGSSSSSSSGSVGWGLKGVAMNGITFGFLPDDGSGQGGQRETIQDISSSLGGITIGPQGYYAQAQSGTLFTGGQLTAKMDEIKQNGGVFQPAVMPTGGWWGLTSSDNQQAVAICKVMKQFTDEGLEVWLRFAHEVNWYQEDGTYQGGVSDFKEGWATVAAACKSIAPEVKMWFTPNVASMDQYEQYFPDDINTVDLIGIDYYPSNPSATAFIDAMKPFHDKYTSDTVKFAIGEMGLGDGADMSTRLAYAKSATSADAAKALPNLIAVSWFNYMKGYDFRIANVQGDSVVKTYLSLSV